MLSLTDLDLDGNDLTDISALSNLTSLEDLWLGSNERLASLNPLSQLSNLKFLEIDPKWEENHSCLDGIEGLEIDYWGSGNDLSSIFETFQKVTAPMN